MQSRAKDTPCEFANQGAAYTNWQPAAARPPCPKQAPEPTGAQPTNAMRKAATGHTTGSQTNTDGALEQHASTKTNKHADVSGNH